MIGERLLDLRKDAGLTQDELAVILKINKHSISSYERDKSELPTAASAMCFKSRLVFRPRPRRALRITWNF